MEVNTFIKFKGEKIPYVNTPLTREQIWSLRDNYDRFIVNDVRRGTAEFYKGEQINKNYSVDLDFKHVFYFVVSIYGVYKFFSTKKKIKKTVEKYNPISKDENFTEKLNDWAIRPEPMETPSQEAEA